MSTSAPTVPPWENADQLLPRGVAQDFIGSIEERSIALALGRTMRMSEATESIPVIAFRPTAKFVTPAYGGRKPVTEVRWTAVEIKAEEVAATIPVPNAWIMDASFDVEGQVERELAGAVAFAIDQAILTGDGAPASFPTGGVEAFATEVSGPDALAAVDAGMTELETQGVTPDGIAAGPAIGSALRQAYREIGELPSVVPQRVLYGVPVETSLNWQADADAIIGGWQYLAIGIREDVTFGRSNDGVLLNDAGAVIASAFQDNVTLIKIYARVGCAIGRPLRANSNTPVDPFVAAKWNGATRAAASSSEDPDPAAARRARSRDK
jgi:hypothetical protein